MIEHEDDWMKTRVCGACCSVPCDCSLVTRAVERAWLTLGAYLRYRQHVRQVELQRRIP